MEKLRLEIPSLSREQDAIEYVDEVVKANSSINGSNGLYRYVQYGDYAGWIKKIKRDAKLVPNDEVVPSLTYFLVREEDNRIIGMITIRLSLNDNLREVGGNIGFGIRPTERGKGYNKINLYLALQICKEYGLDNILIDCDKDDEGSIGTIEALGGKLEKEKFNDFYECVILDYWVDVKKSLVDYRDVYESCILNENEKKLLKY